MADDIDELLDEVESKFIHNEDSGKLDNYDQSQTVMKHNADGTGELDAAIHSICSIPEPIESTSSASDYTVQLSKEAKRRCTVVYVGDSGTASGLSGGVTQRKTVNRRMKHSSATKIYTKKYYTKPVFELSVKALEAENARRKQKEIVEKLFAKGLAVVTDKMILDVRKFKRIKSDVWSNFGDVRLLISLPEIKTHNIGHHVIRIGEEEVVLCKSFVACVKCSAVFSYESHSYGTSTLRSHLKSCGKQRHNKGDKKGPQKSNNAVVSKGNDNRPEKPVFQEQMVKFRDHASKLQQQILMFCISKLKSFNILENQEFKDLLQTFIQIGATAGNVDISSYLCSPDDLVEYLVNDLYVANDEAFKFEIQHLYGLNFSSEIWLDIVEKVSYVTISCHYSNFDGVLKSVMFHTSEYPYEQKSSTDLYALFQDCMPLSPFDFKRLMVIDYSYNMVHAFKNEQFIQCICYSLNCAVQTVVNALNSADEKETHEEDTEEDSSEDPFAFPSFVSLLSQSRSLVSHFKDNKLQSSLPKNLKMCSNICWMPILEMLESINSQWEHIADILLDRNELELFCLDEELLGIVVDFLQIFRDGYNELSSLSNPTLNLVLPWINKWKTHCIQNEDEPPFLAAFKSFMSSSIDQEVVKRITINHKLATMLDPRFKDLTFLSEDDRFETRSHAEFMVKECSETLIMNGVDVQSAASVLEQLDEFYGTETEMVPFSLEVEEYLSDNFIMGKLDLDGENKFNPLKYWNQAKDRLPHLTRIALWILSCPASAIRTEECFLGSEWMVTIKETDLPRKHLQKCLFNKSYKGFHCISNMEK